MSLQWVRPESQNPDTDKENRRKGDEAQNRRQWRHGLTDSSGESESKLGKGGGGEVRAETRIESDESESQSRDEREREN